MILRRTGIILLLLASLACSRKEKVSISGTIENTPRHMMSYLEEVRISSNRVIDSTRIKNNSKFRYKLSIQDPGFYQFRLSDGKSLTLILSPGEKLSIRADYNDFYHSKELTGSPNSERVNVLHDSLRNTIVELGKIRKAYAMISDSLPGAAELRDSLTQRFLALRTKHHRYSVKFVLEDLRLLSNIAALYQEYAPDAYVFNRNRDIQYFKLVSDTLMKYFPNVKHVKAVRDNYQSFISNYNAQRLMQNTDIISYDIPDIKLPSLSGEEIKLSSLKGKYVLLSFWSVNQKESVQNTMELKTAYSKLKNREFEIYQVSVDKSFDAFRRRVNFEDLPWICVCDTSFPNSLVRGQYNVNTLPMNYLLDKGQTEILAKNLPPDEIGRFLNYVLTTKP